MEVTHTENPVNLRHVVFKICEPMDRHTDTLTAVFCTPTDGKVMSIPI